MEPNRKRNVIIGLFLFAFLIGGLGVSLVLVNREQDIRNQASTSMGTAMVSISPTGGSIAAGSSLPVTVSLDTAGNIISAVAVRLNYTYSGTAPGITAENIQIDPAFLTGGDWICPVKKFTTAGGKANIDIACANTSTTGYSSNSIISLATFSLTASASASNGNFSLAFDPKESIITKKADSTDVLLTPASTGTFTVTGGSAAAPRAVVHRYRCSGNSCILDDVLGTFTSPNCENSCLRPATPPPPAPTVITNDTRVMPATGNFPVTLAVIGSGLFLLILSFFYSRTPVNTK